MATESGAMPADATEQGTELTTTQAAALAGVTEKTIRDWAKAGHIVALRTPQGRRFDRDSLLGYLRTRSVQAAERVPREAQPVGTPEPTPYHTPYSVPPSPTVSVASPETSTEPLEAAYRVTPAEIEQAVSRTSAQYMGDLRTMLAEVGKVYEGQLAAKGQTIDTQAAMLAELRRRAEVAEAEADALRLRLAEVSVPAVVVVARQDAPEGQDTTAKTATTHRPVQGFWWRLRRVLGRVRTG